MVRKCGPLGLIAYRHCRTTPPLAVSPVRGLCAAAAKRSGMRVEVVADIVWEDLPEEYKPRCLALHSDCEYSTFRIHRFGEHRADCSRPWIGYLQKAFTPYALARKVQDILPAVRGIGEPVT